MAACSLCSFSPLRGGGGGGSRNILDLRSFPPRSLPLFSYFFALPTICNHSTSRIPAHTRLFTLEYNAKNNIGAEQSLKNFANGAQLDCFFPHIHWGTHTLCRFYAYVPFVGCHFFLLAPLIQTIRYICWPFVSSSFLSCSGPATFVLAPPPALGLRLKTNPCPFTPFYFLHYPSPPTSLSPSFSLFFTLFSPGAQDRAARSSAALLLQLSENGRSCWRIFFYKKYMSCCALSFIFRRQPGIPAASQKKTSLPQSKFCRAGEGGGEGEDATSAYYYILMSPSLTVVGRQRTEAEAGEGGGIAAPSPVLFGGGGGRWRSSSSLEEEEAAAGRGGGPLPSR